MKKMINFILITIVMVLMFNFYGLLGGGDVAISTYIIGTLHLDNPSQINANQLLFVLVASLSTITIAGLIIGIFIGGSSVQDKVAVTVKAGLISLIMAIMWDLMVVTTKLSQISLALSALFISPIIVYFVFAIIEWYNGTG